MNKPETIRFYRQRLPHWEVADGRYFVTIHLKGAIPATGIERVKRRREQLDVAIANGQPGLEERRAIFREMEHWLDCAPHLHHLTDPRVATMITEAIEHREQQGLWTVFSYVIMPNHLHMFFRLGRSQFQVAHAGLCVRPEDARAYDAGPASTTGAGASGTSDAGPASTTGAGASGTSDAGPASATGTHRRIITLENVLKPFKHWTAREAKRILNLPKGPRFWQCEWFDHWSRSADEDEKIKRYIHANPTKAGLTPNKGIWPWLK